MTWSLGPKIPRLKVLGLMIHGTLGPRTLDPRHLRSWTNDLNVNSTPIFACPSAQSQWTSPMMVTMVQKDVYSNLYSQAVTHPSTNRSQPCLTSVIGRELVYSM